MSEFLTSAEGIIPPATTLEEIEVRDSDIDALIEKLKTFDLDDNTYRILYKASSTIIALLSFTLTDEEARAFLRGSSAYIGWTQGGVVSANQYYPFTSENFGNAVTPAQNASASYFSGTYSKVYSGKIENIYYSNIDIYDTDKENIVYKADKTLWLKPDDVIIDGVTHEPFYVGDSEVSFTTNVLTGAAQEVREIAYEYLDFELPFSRYGAHSVRVNVETVSGTQISEIYTFTVYPDRDIPYPTDTPLPPEDGHRDVVIIGDGTTTYCATFDYIAEPTVCYYTGSRLVGTGTGGVCTNSSLYQFNGISGVWESISPTTYTYFNRIYSHFSMDMTGAVLYSTVDIYTASDLAELLFSAQLPLPREKYDPKTMQVAPAIEYTDPLLFDASTEGYIVMRDTQGSTSVYAFCLRATEPGASLGVSFEPTTQLKTIDGVEMCILRRTASDTDWTIYRQWGAYDYHSFSSKYGNLFFLIEEIYNVNIYIHSKNRVSGRLIYEVEKVRRPLPAIITLQDGKYRIAEDVASHVKLFDGETWKGIELSDAETGVAIYDGTQWLNLGLFNKEEE